MVGLRVPGFHDTLNFFPDDDLPETETKIKYGWFTWMSRTGSDRINGDRISGLFHPLINGFFVGVK